MTSTILIILFCVLPGISLITLLVSLCLLLAAKAANKQEPGTYTQKQIQRYRLAATVSGIVTGVFAGIILGLFGLLYMAVAYM